MTRRNRRRVTRACERVERGGEAWRANRRSGNGRVVGDVGTTRQTVRPCTHLALLHHGYRRKSPKGKYANKGRPSRVPPSTIPPPPPYLTLFAVVVSLLALRLLLPLRVHERPRPCLVHLCLYRSPICPSLSVDFANVHLLFFACVYPPAFVTGEIRLGTINSEVLRGKCIVRLKSLGRGATEKLLTIKGSKRVVARPG